MAQRLKLFTASPFVINGIGTIAGDNDAKKQRLLDRDVVQHIAPGCDKRREY